MINLTLRNLNNITNSLDSEILTLKKRIDEIEKSGLDRYTLQLTIKEEAISDLNLLIESLEETKRLVFERSETICEILG